MRKIKDILRLRYEAKLSYRDIAQALNIGYGTVVDYLTRAKQAQVSWPMPADMGELKTTPFPLTLTNSFHVFEPPRVFRRVFCLSQATMADPSVFS